VARILKRHDKQPLQKRVTKVQSFTKLEQIKNPQPKEPAMFNEFFTDLFLDFSEIDAQIVKLRQLLDSFRKINGEQNRYINAKSHFAPHVPAAQTTAGATESQYV
jgi:hypothetical protein